ncbi:ABC transporter substrate-binding protein [Marinomonas sp. IMCC 4694]|uniref:ABC transporter substrate-binding protein n=1 Tax=Marinomonas sp. IMCC 4694 TaxID=2605432 RepID=UPI0011E6EC4B|nr:ABC transporter substrate-binding protein [Marinomonas sp. IMCC 4694]TYL48533.1 ABC transporter substrate-binding protein [Marinomonas sp. IMCC 4694]
MYKKSILAGLMTVAATSSFAADSCGKIQIADMNWNSASLMANVDKFILENGYGCDAELIPGDTMPTSTSMAEKGQPDIAPEMWTNAVKALIDRGVADGRLSISGQSLSDGGEEGFWVPKYMVDADPSLATIEGIKQHAKAFPNPEDASVSAFYGCPAGWGCQITAGNLFKALNLQESGFELIDPGSSAGLSGSLSRAYERKASWFGYYWAPTAILGKYDMVKVDFGTGVDTEHYIKCIAEDSCMDPKVTMYPPSPVFTITTTDFQKNAPEAYAYTTKRAFTNAQMNGLLAWMEDNQADGQYAAENFMFTYPEIWSKWVDKDVKAKIDKALDSL